MWPSRGSGHLHSTRSRWNLAADPTPKVMLISKQSTRRPRSPRTPTCCFRRWKKHNQAHSVEYLYGVSSHQCKDHGPGYVVDDGQEVWIKGAKRHQSQELAKNHGLPPWQWSARPGFNFQDRDRDCLYPSLNNETETETMNLKVSMSRPRPRLWIF